MGNKQQTKEKVDLVSSHSAFKAAKVISQNDQRHITALVASDNEGYNTWDKLLSLNEKQLTQNQFLLLPKKHSFTKQGLCSNTGNVTIQYEYFPYLLSEQIASRHEKQQRFRQSDLWYLLYTLFGAKKQSDNLGQRVGDIRPQNVFISHDGQVKIGSIFSYPNENSNYRKAIDLQPTLLAPEDVDKLSLGASNNNENVHSQTFSIGLTVIAAGILQNPSVIYELKTFVFDREEASKLINKWRSSKNYSQIFKGIVSNLVQFNPQDRVTFAQLWTWISKYENNIKSKQKFLMTAVPAKIEKEVSELRKFIQSFDISKEQNNEHH